MQMARPFIPIHTMECSPWASLSLCLHRSYPPRSFSWRKDASEDDMSLLLEDMPWLHAPRDKSFKPTGNKIKWQKTIKLKTYTTIHLPGMFSIWWRRWQMNPSPRLEKKWCEPKSNSHAFFMMPFQMPDFIDFVLGFRTWYARKFPSMTNVLHNAI